MAVVVKRLLGLDLKKAGLVIGYLGIFFGIWELIEIILGIVYFEENYSAKNKEQILPDKKTAYYNLMFLMLVVSLLDFSTSILLIRGISTNLHKRLLPWLILKGFALVLLIPGASLCFFVGIYFVAKGQSSILMVYSILLLIATGLFSYIYMVIYSLYYYIRDEIHKPQEIDPENLYSNSNVIYNKA